MTEIERDGSAPEVPSTGNGGGEEDYLYLPGLLSDEFGLPRSQARMEIIMGGYDVKLDDEPVSFENAELVIPRSSAEGKTLEVKGSGRSFKMQIPAST